MEGLGEVLEVILASKLGPEKAKLIFSMKLRFLRDLGKVLGGFGEGLGRGREGVGEHFGRIWAGFWRVLGRLRSFIGCVGGGWAFWGYFWWIFVKYSA